MPRQAILSQQEKREWDRLKKRWWREDRLRRSLEREHSALATPQWRGQREEGRGATRRRRHVAQELDPGRRKDPEAKKQRRQRRRKEQARALWRERVALVQLRGEGDEGGRRRRDPSRPPGPTAPWGTQPRYLSACLELLWGLEKKGFCGVGPAGGGGWVNLNMFWAPSDGLW